MNTEDACEVNRRRCSIACAEEEEKGTNVIRRKSRKRSSLLDGIRYGAAAIKRDLDDSRRTSSGEVGLMDDTHRSVGSTNYRRRRSSISAGEGVWLIKDNEKRCQHHRRSFEHQTISSSYGDNNNNNLNYDNITNRKAPGTSSIPKHNNKTVHFSTVSVRYHPIILGNNPFVSSGPSLELSWGHESSMNELNIPIDEFEATHSPHRRREWDLALSRGERETQLLEMGFTREEIAAAIRETSEIKSQRANTVLNLKMAGIEEFTEKLRTRGGELIGLRKNPDWMYNDGRSIPALGQVAAKKDESLLMEVENIDGVRRSCKIRPRNHWGGRGCFGFLFRELRDGR